MRADLEKAISYHRGALEQIEKDIQESLKDRELHTSILEDLTDEFNQGNLSPEKQAEAQSKGYEEGI